MVLFTGNTVEEAIDKGLKQLQLSRSQVNITVLAKEKSGFLGFGKQEAQVEMTALQSSVVVEEKITAEPVPQPEPIEEKEETSLVHDETVVQGLLADDFEAFVAQESVEETKEEVRAEEDKEQVENEDEQSSADTLKIAGEDVLSYLRGIVAEMGVEASLSLGTGRRQLLVQINTTTPGRLIGYHGKVLKALQLLGQNYLQDRYSRHFYLSINVNDYLEYRTETLVQMAHKAARRVQETGRDYRLEPMSNSERKLIHKTITKISGVESYSEGDEPERYVVVVSRD